MSRASGTVAERCFLEQDYSHVTGIACLTNLPTDTLSSFHTSVQILPCPGLPRAAFSLLNCTKYKLSCSLSVETQGMMTCAPYPCWH